MFLKSLTAWLSLVVAVIALVLSQFPPIPSYFASPHISFTAKGLHIKHSLGLLSLTPYLHINNSGKARSTISKIELILAKQNHLSFRRTLFAQFYYLEPSTLALNQAPTPIPFSNIAIPSGETWGAYVDFHKSLSNAEKIQFADISEKVNEEIQAGFSNKPPSVKELVKISDDLFGKIKSISDEQLESFQVGQYTLRFNLFDDSNSEIVAKKCYSFAVFEHHLNIIRTITDQYQTGAGILFMTPAQKGFYVDLVDTNCTH